MLIVVLKNNIQDIKIAQIWNDKSMSKEFVGLMPKSNRNNELKNLTSNTKIISGK